MLVRHAKSDWDDPSLKDFDRPLNRRGLANAPLMADRLIHKHLVPQYVVSSPALRAKTTAKLFTQQMGLVEPAYNEDIYEASYPTLLNIVNQLPDEYDFVALFGHNPGMGQLIYKLSGQSYDIPTCAVTVISFDVESWEMISADTGKVEYYDYPKNGISS